MYLDNSPLVAVSVSTEGGFTVGASQQLFEPIDLRVANSSLNYSFFPDGRHVAVSEPVAEEGESREARVRIVENWYEEFCDREE